MTASDLNGRFPIDEHEGNCAVRRYILKFNAEGDCISPETRTALLDDIKQNDYTTIYFMCHGWNNTFADAIDFYNDFRQQYFQLLARDVSDIGVTARPQKPLWIGICWPSIILAGRAGAGPAIAGVSDETYAKSARSDEPMDAEEYREQIEWLATTVEAEQRPRFLELSRQSALSPDTAREFISLLLPVSTGFADVDEEADQASVENILAGFLDENLTPEDDPDGIAGMPGAAHPKAIAVAGDTSTDYGRLFMDGVVRSSSVWKMKDRAGIVGRQGISPLLAEINKASDGRVKLHLLGHSFGCRVILTAVAAASFEAGRPVESILLLQPAVSARCFAADATGHGKPGGFHVALNRVRQPILTTFSNQDFVLYSVYEQIMTRRCDIGEEALTAAPVNYFAALGGYGPQKTAEAAAAIQMLSPPQRYVLETASRIIPLEGHQAIAGHGKIRNQATCWALACQYLQGYGDK